MIIDLIIYLQQKLKELDLTVKTIEDAIKDLKKPTKNYSLILVINIKRMNNIKLSLCI